MFSRWKLNAFLLTTFFIGIQISNLALTWNAAGHNIIAQKEGAF